MRNRSEYSANNQLAVYRQNYRPTKPATSAGFFASWGCTVVVFAIIGVLLAWRG